MRQAKAQELLDGLTVDLPLDGRVVVNYGGAYYNSVYCLVAGRAMGYPTCYDTARDNGCGVGGHEHRAFPWPASTHLATEHAQHQRLVPARPIDGTIAVVADEGWLV